MNTTIDPKSTPGLYRVRQLSQRLSGLLAQPQPGLTTWQRMLSDTLEELACYCGTEVAELAEQSRARRGIAP